MTNQLHASRSETTLIVLASVLLGIVIGGVGGFLVGRSNMTSVVLVASPVPQSSLQPPPATEPASATVELASVRPELASVTAIGKLDPVVTALPSRESTTQATASLVSAQASPLPTDQPHMSAATAQPADRPTISIPQARTATPIPGRVETITISDDRATSLANEKIRRSPVGAFLSNPTVQFVPGGMELHGDVSDPTNQIASGPLDVHGNFQKEGANLRFRIDNAQINGTSVPTNVSDEIEGIINQIFRDELVDRKVESYDAQVGQLLVTVSLRQ